MQDEAISRARAILSQHEQKYRKSAWRWKVGYRALLVSSALFSTSAAIVGKLEYYGFDGGSDIAAVLAGLAAVITTLIAALDFEVNWRINRKSRHDVVVIDLEAEKSTADADKLLDELQKVVKQRNEDLNKQD
jgi:hypothetical protein